MKVLVDTSVWSLALRRKEQSAANNNLYIFTTDNDFHNYAKYLPIKLLPNAT